MPRRTLLTALLLLVAVPALAFDTAKLDQGGSLTLDEIMPLINKTPKLKREVAEALKKAGKKSNEVICTGKRFNSQWTELGGFRVSPYTCDFAGQWLRIKATVKLTSRKGKAFETITPEAMKTAYDISETNPTWAWTATEPPDDE